MAALRAGANMRLGVVVRFETGRGLGNVTELPSPTAREKGLGYEPASYPFHSTAIADGSRQIVPGTAVAFVLVPSHGGVFEARELRPLPSTHRAAT